jgi:hypothetical protein
MIVGPKLALIAWAACTLLKVYPDLAPIDTLSTTTFVTQYPVRGVMLKLLLVPITTGTLPEGEMLPPVPVLAVMITVGFWAKVAEIVCGVITLAKVYVAAVPAGVPSISTSIM